MSSFQSNRNFGFDNDMEITETWSQKRGEACGICSGIHFFTTQLTSSLLGKKKKKCFWKEENVYWSPFFCHSLPTTESCFWGWLTPPHPLQSLLNLFTYRVALFPCQFHGSNVVGINWEVQFRVWTTVTSSARDCNTQLIRISQNISDDAEKSLFSPSGLQLAHPTELWFLSNAILIEFRALNDVWWKRKACRGYRRVIALESIQEIARNTKMTRD